MRGWSYDKENIGKIGGFDIVIANPPYVRHEGIKEQKPALKSEFADFYKGTADLYAYFYKRGIEILAPEAHICFIAPNKFFRAGYGDKLRNLFVEAVTPHLVIDFKDLPIFDATTYPAILLLENRKPGKDEVLTTATFENPSEILDVAGTMYRRGAEMKITDLNPDGWVFLALRCWRC